MMLLRARDSNIQSFACIWGDITEFYSLVLFARVLNELFRASCSLDKNGIPKRSRPMLVKNFHSESRNGKMRHLRQIVTVVSL